MNINGRNTLACLCRIDTDDAKPGQSRGDLGRRGEGSRGTTA